MGNTTKKAFPVLNMHCAGCANNVEKTVKKLPGVIEASVNFATNTLTVSYEKEQLTPGEIRAAVLAAGYDLIVEEAHKEERREEEQHKRYTRLKWKVIGAWILVVPLLVYSMILMHVPYFNEIQMVLAIPVMVFFGGGFFTGAWKQAKLGRSNMDTLVALSTSIAFLFSLFNTFFPEFWYDRGLEPHVYYEASAVIIAFVLTGKLMEERAKGNTSTAIRKLMGMQPKAARVLRNGGEEEILIEKLQEGDLVTSIVNNKDCVFTCYDENGCCYCAIEKAYREGKTAFYKPVSCHLYPIRIGDYGPYKAVNYNRWDVCKAAVLLGKKENLPVYQFLKEPLIRKFGEEWYKELVTVAEELKKQQYI